ncbi:hypothetical protein [Corynebacterium sanguinis]|uniref:hypothetical protein n=1 Tax=Corynebacterium sanguinis TaxID=2594913 RepID=UPI001184F7BB|nr:hypothetical protein [Corynebacterium sanguinis]MCT2024387.1 hypothetical protein [Corynebacterium sanguinis]QDR77635.1 hypothetical protein E3227_05880 [Corynebacterium sanguinis]
MYQQTATALLMSALTATPAQVIVEVAATLQSRDWPTPAHRTVWQAIAAHADDLTRAGQGATLPVIEDVAGALTQAGDMNNEYVRAVLLDAVGTVRGGRSTPPQATERLANLLRRYRLLNVLKATAEALQQAADAGDDAIRRAVRYTRYLPTYAARAGVSVDD